MPPKIIDQINSFGKSDLSMSIDTVKGFLRDSKNQNLDCNSIILNLSFYLKIVVML